jgi:hypothetical protein
MGHKWIIAVLADLRTYAELNDLTRLAASLDELERTAEDEIVSIAGRTPAWARADGTGAGIVFGAARSGALAG